ncbi:MAG: YhdP family protein [Cobetia amphilecti]
MTRSTSPVTRSTSPEAARSTSQEAAQEGVDDAPSSSAATPAPPSRGRRWARGLLMALAVLLAVLAILIGGLRWWLTTLDSRSESISDFIATQTHSNVGMSSLEGRMDHLDPAIKLSGLNLFRPNEMQAAPLLSVSHLETRLDVLSSLRHLAPVFDRATATGVIVHLYQREDGSWGWPGPPRPPEALEPEGQMSLAQTEQGLALLARQRVRLEDVRLVLHGRNDTLNLNAAELLLSGEGDRAHLEGQLRVGESPQAGVSAVLEVLPGDDGLADYSAQLQVELDAGALASVGRLMGERDSLMLRDADGNATLWARWRDARLEDARLRLDLNRLTLDHHGAQLALKDIHARGQWLRDLAGSDRWQAWLNQISVGATQLDDAPAAGASVAGSDGQTPQAASSPEVSAALASLPERISLSGDLAEGSVSLVTSSFDLEKVARWRNVLALGELGDVLESLDPRGTATGLSLSLAGIGLDTPLTMKLALGLTGAEVEPWQGAPGLGPLAAWVTAQSLDEGGIASRIAFRGDPGMRFHFPEVFGDGWQLEAADGVVEVKVDDSGSSVSGHDLHIQRAGADVTGGFGLQIPAQDHDRFQLDLEMRDVDARSIPLASWLPMKVLDPALSEWLTRDVAGQVPEGSLHLTQVWDDDNGENGYGPGDSMDLELAIEDGRLGYAEGWPALEGVKGNLALHDNTLSATVAAAHSQPATALGSAAPLAVRQADVDMQDNTLKIQGDVTGSVEALFDLLSHAPLEDTAALIAEWQGKGSVDATMDIRVPLEDAEQTRITAAGKVGERQAATLAFPGPGIEVDGIRGPLEFVHDPSRPEGRREQLTGNLSGKLFGGAVKAALNIGQADSSSKGAITFDGKAPLAPVLGWLGAPEHLIGDAAENTRAALQDGETPRALGGEFNYQARLMLPDDGASLALSSDLKGVAINLPAPFGKTRDQAAPLAVDIGLAEGGGDVRLDNRARARWKGGNTRDDGSTVPMTGQLWLERWPSDPQWPTQTGWDIAWRTPTLAPELWKPWAGALSGEGGASGEGSASDGGSDAEQSDPLRALSRLRVATDCLMIQSRCTGPMTLEAAPRQSSQQQGLGLAATLDGQLASGELVWQSGAARPLILDLDTLNLDALWPADAEQETQTASAPSNFTEAIDVGIEPTPYPAELADLPAGSLRLAHLIWRDQQLGPISADWTADSQQLVVLPLSITLGKITAVGNITWEDAGANSLTRARLSADGSDLGGLLERLSQPRGIEADRARAEVKLAWPGAPQDFALSRSNGRVEIKLDDGRFLNLGSTSARLLGLVNVDNLLRRLSLDFSDVTDKGTAFDKVRGAATLFDGRLESDGPLRIEAPSTTVTLNGQVDLLRGTLDQRMAITVPVSQNLPLAAVLAGAPAVGGALFVADKIFGRFIDKVTQIHYRVSGPWGDPNITLESAE